MKLVKIGAFISWFTHDWAIQKVDSVKSTTAHDEISMKMKDGEISEGNSEISLDYFAWQLIHPKLSVIIILQSKLDHLMKLVEKYIDLPWVRKDAKEHSLDR